MSQNTCSQAEEWELISFFLLHVQWGMGLLSFYTGSHIIHVRKHLQNYQIKGEKKQLLGLLHHFHPSSLRDLGSFSFFIYMILPLNGEDEEQKESRRGTLARCRGAEVSRIRLPPFPLTGLLRSEVGIMVSPTIPSYKVER